MADFQGGVTALRTACNLPRIVLDADRATAAIGGDRSSELIVLALIHRFVWGWYGVFNTKCRSYSAGGRGAGEAGSGRMIVGVSA